MYQNPDWKALRGATVTGVVRNGLVSGRLVSSMCLCYIHRHVESWNRQLGGVQLNFQAISNLTQAPRPPR